jgi:hypothetical protein
MLFEIEIFEIGFLKMKVYPLPSNYDFQPIIFLLAFQSYMEVHN